MHIHYILIPSMYIPYTLSAYIITTRILSIYTFNIYILDT
jgi:hypothetical protein